VIGVGPQIGVLFPVGNLQGYINLKRCADFDNQNRPDGWNTWIMFALSPSAETPASAQPTLCASIECQTGVRCRLLVRPVIL
jgi:hypothetical protein